MPIGTTIPIPLQHDEQLPPIIAEDSYFAISLHNAQAYVQLPWLAQTAYLVCGTEIKSTFLPNHATHNIHKVETIQKTPPARSASVSI